ncbi:hypothetical protein T492DRAFT_903148 [Pavlovales sp. CCMP2436]|nr:hypothetical protein T492DRAFT_903148 [Pavlovales sp. CCMP2436]
MRRCTFKRFDAHLRALKPDLALNSSALVEMRLTAAQRPLECSATRSRFVFIPAAVGDEDGWMMLDSPPHALIRGGSMTKDYIYRVRTADVASWMFKSFSAADYVVMKVDIEGAEHSFMPKLMRLSGGLELVDALAMECHAPNCEQLLRLIGSAAKKAGFRTVNEGSYNGMDSHSRPPNFKEAGRWARVCTGGNLSALIPRFSGHASQRFLKYRLRLPGPGHGPAPGSASAGCARVMIA